MRATLPDAVRQRVRQLPDAITLLRVHLELPADQAPRPQLPVSAAPAFAWAEPDRDFAFAGWGAAVSLEAQGPERFAAIAARGRQIATQSVELGAKQVPGETPFWVGGFAFDHEGCRREPWHGFAPARWWVPEALLVRRDGRTWAIVATRTEGRDPTRWIARLEAQLRALLEEAPGAARGATRPNAPVAPWDGERSAFLERVRSARQAVREGKLEKLVVARELGVQIAVDSPAAALLARLGRSHPGCRVFAVRCGDGLFLGSSPERLVSVRGRRLWADALAGSAARGADARRDEQLARMLRESKKEQEEHAVVVRALWQALAPACRVLQLPEAPRVRRLATIQHLHTPIRGLLRAPRPFAVLELAGRVHPTPAVAGAPREAALAWLRRHEGIERGWYAGLVGWLDARGEGDLAVALRSALLRPGAAWLYAGAGIVAGSEPETELAETDLKLRTVGDALAGDVP